MNRGTKILIWLLIIAALLTSTYFLLQKEKTLSFIYGPGFDSLKKAIPEEEKEAAESFKNVLSEKATEIKAGVGEILTGTLTETFNKGESAVSQLVQWGLEKTKKTAGEILGVNNDSNLFVEYFSYLTKIDEPLSFILRNPLNPQDSKELNYQIDWGDNQKNEGKLQGGESIIFSHSWKKEGEYLAKFKITAAESEIFDYQIKVLVIK